MKKAIAVVTGGAGFIGSHMVDYLLSHGYTVRVIDHLKGGRIANLEHLSNHAELTVDTRDIRNLAPDDSLMREARYVFHFAGIGDIVPSIDQPIDYMSTNVQGTVHVLEAARHAGVQKLVYAASSSCYGLATQVPTPETAAMQPEYPYALSKYLGELAVLHWGTLYHLPVVSIRIFNAYGPRSRTTGAYGAVMGVFLAQKLANKPFTVVGDGLQKRDFIFVSDVVRAFFMAAQSPMTGQIYNVGAGNPQTINYLTELLGGDVMHIPKRPGEPDCTWADIAKIKHDLGWQPQVSFEVGVGKMIQCIDAWKNAPIWDAASIAHATQGWFGAFASKFGEAAP